ncbi:MAG: glycosyltransferase family 4 protein [Armatimonadetes bacterium]|nr:glycosyltransferase family 4 protein [Armatimonadota bacterium]
MRVEDLSMFRFLHEVLNRVNVAYVATYPPAECGIATFTRDLVTAIQKFTPFSEPHVVAINEEGQILRYDPRYVKHTISKQDKESYREAAEYINDGPIDVVSVQHEFGIFGGSEGEHLIDFLAEVRKPIVTTLHTVVLKPWGSMRAGVDAIFRYSNTVVAMLDIARDILEDVYGVDTSKLRIIPHGVPNVPRLPIEVAKRNLGLDGRKIISTFGLVSRGKGLEYAIQAMPPVVERFPDALYLILGQTHPAVRRYEGEVYRNELDDWVRRLGMRRHVRFDNRYLSLEELINYLSATDVYITPYVNPDQIVSGTLAYAIGCGKAIVSTPYLYARSSLGDGRGLLAGFQDPRSMADGITRILGDGDFRGRMEDLCYQWGRRTTWHNVAIEYLDVFYHLTAGRRIAA